MVFINYIVDNYVLLFELVGLLIMLKISAHVSRTNKRYTLLVICLLFLESLVSSLELWTQTFDHFVLARPLLTYTKYAIYPLIIFSLMQITVEKTTSTKKILLYLIPEFICILIFYSSQWTKLVSYFDEENHYHGGVLNYLPYVLFGFYMILFLINNIIYFKHHARIVKRIVIYIVAGSVIGIGLYMAFLEIYDFTDLFTAAIVLYYLCFYIHLAKIDPLTSLLNRQSYYQDIILYDDDITGVVSIDMNELKITNDTYGHEAGDTALREISRVMRENCGKKRFCLPYWW